MGFLTVENGREVKTALVQESGFPGSRVDFAEKRRRSRRCFGLLVRRRTEPHPHLALPVTGTPQRRGQEAEALCKAIRPVRKSAHTSTACSRLTGGSPARQSDLLETVRQLHHATDPRLALGKLLTFEGPPFLSPK